MACQDPQYWYFLSNTPLLHPCPKESFHAILKRVGIDIRGNDQGGRNHTLMVSVSLDKYTNNHKP